MAIPFGRHDALGPQQEDETLEQRGIGCEADGLETFEGVLIRAFVIQARLAHGGDDDPVAREIDGVAIRLIHCRHAAPGKRAVQRVARALAFEGDDELLLILLEAAEHGVGKFAVHLDMRFAGQREGVGGASGAGVTEQIAKDVGEEIGEQCGFLEIVGAAGSDQIRPVLELGRGAVDARGQLEGADMLTDDLRVEDGFGFDSHDV